MQHRVGSSFFPYFDALLRDLRYAARSLAKNPGFSFAVLAILATGIGATTAVFSVVDAVLIRPLAVREQSKLAVVWKRDRQSGNPLEEFSIPEFRDLRDQNQVFSCVAAMPTSVYGYGFTVTGVGEPFQIESARVSADFFSVLGSAPQYGRDFVDSDDRPGAGPTAVISHSLWLNHFSADPTLVGRQITLDGSGYTVIGIMPADFDFPSGADIWTPLELSRSAVGNRGVVYLQLVGRLKPDVSLAQAQTNLDAVIANIADQHPEGHTVNQRAAITPITRYVVGSAGPALILLMGASGLLLIIVCANIAGLLAVRTLGRRKEMAVRAALGAGRGRLAWQLITESVLLAVGGGSLGSILALWMLNVFKAIAPADVPRIAGASINIEALAFAGFAALVSLTVFGLAPAVTASTVNLSDALKGGSISIAGGSPHRLRSVLVVCQVALTVVLAVAATLIAISFRSLTKADLGFEQANLLTAEVSLRGNTYGDPARRRQWYHELIERLEKHPNIGAAGMVLVRPLQGTVGWDVPYRAEGQSVSDVARNPVPNFEIVTPHYFKAMAIPLLTGREFSDEDTPQSPPVVIVSRSAARQFFGTDDAVGKRIQLGAVGANSPWVTIVGVVADARYRGLENVRLDTYVPDTQRLFPTRYIMIRAAGPASAITDILRQEVSAMDSTQAVSGTVAMSEMVNRALARPRFSMTLLVFFAGVAALLAAAGIYAIVSFTVTEKTRETGIRMALGAIPTQVVMGTVGKAFRLVIAGVMIGLGVAAIGTQLIQSLLYEVAVRDPWVFGGVGLSSLLAAVAAAYIPARRASRIAPSSAFRHE